MATVTTTTMARAAQGDGQAYLANEGPATAAATAATAAAIGQAPAHEAVQTEPAAAQVTQRPYIGRSLAAAAAAARGAALGFGDDAVKRPGSYAHSRIGCRRLAHPHTQLQL